MDRVIEDILRRERSNVEFELDRVKTNLHLAESDVIKNKGLVELFEKQLLIINQELSE